MARAIVRTGAVSAAATGGAVSATVTAASILARWSENGSPRYPFKFDHVSLSDAVQVALERGIIAFDTLTATDQITQRVINKVASDNLTTVDALVKHLLLAHLDTLTLSEVASVAYEYAMALADSLTMGESTILFGGTSTITANEAVTLADALATVLSKGVSDNFTVTDALAQALSRLVAETVNTADGLTMTTAYARAVADTVTAAEALSKHLTTPPGSAGTTTLADAGGWGIYNYGSSNYFAEDYVYASTGTF